MVILSSYVRPLVKKIGLASPAVPMLRIQLTQLVLLLMMWNTILIGGECFNSLNLLLILEHLIRKNKKPPLRCL